MPTYEDIRSSSVARTKAHWDAAYPDVPMYYDNAHPKDAEIDKLKSYVMCSIEFTPGGQLNLSPTPGHRTRGYIVFTAACLEGDGSAKVLRYLDSLAGAMKFANFDGIVTGEPIPGKPLTDDGWFSYDLMIPFYADSIN